MLSLRPLYAVLRQLRLDSVMRLPGGDAGKGLGNPSQWLHPGNAVLRRAIRENVVSFPSQVPILARQFRDMQWRVVLLYLVRGWSTRNLAIRFRVPLCRISAMIHEWSVRALALGYIQVIDADRFAALAGEHATKSAPLDHAVTDRPPESSAFILARIV